MWGCLHTALSPGRKGVAIFHVCSTQSIHWLACQLCPLFEKKDLATALEDVVETTNSFKMRPPV